MTYAAFRRRLPPDATLASARRAARALGFRLVAVGADLVLERLH